MDDRFTGTAFDPDRWLAEQRTERERTGRARRSSLAGQLEDSATWVGTLLDLAEAADVVAVGTRSGRLHRARVVAVGQDVAVLSPTAGTGSVVVALSAIAWVRADGPARPATGARQAGPFDLAHVLGDLLDDRPVVSVTFVGSAEPARGRLMAVGADVVTLVDEAGRAVLVPTRAIAEALVSN